MKKIIAVAVALICMTAQAGAARRPDIKCGPWVQNVSETEFTVLWTSGEKVFAWVEVAPDDGTAF
ncbi:MAG: purple acid phosphatase, partial [Bacteroidales bacterium]|nr:purple acid phosphatase [Bacteroidales bacterium]